MGFFVLCVFLFWFFVFVFGDLLFCFIVSSLDVEIVFVVIFIVFIYLFIYT